MGLTGVTLLRIALIVPCKVKCSPVPILFGQMEELLGGKSWIHFEKHDDSGQTTGHKSIHNLRICGSERAD